MKVKDLVAELLTLDMEKNIWLMYDPPLSCEEVTVCHLNGDDADYAEMFKGEGVKVGDYAIICE